MFLLCGGIALIIGKLDPKYDKTVSKPVFTEIPTYTNDTSVKIKGEAKKASKVQIYVNDKAVDSYVDVKNDGSFVYSYHFPREGSYEIQAAAIKGFPFRKIGPMNDKSTVIADWTAPSIDVKLNFPTIVDTNKFELTGQVEPNAKVTVKNSSGEYSVTAGDDGSFDLKDIPLTVGDNTFDVIITDRAGNSSELTSKFKVTYTQGSINGSGASTQLPVSAGELDAAKEFLFGNKLMTFFGLTALLILGVNAVIVTRKLKISNR